MEDTTRRPCCRLPSGKLLAAVREVNSAYPTDGDDFTAVCESLDNGHTWSPPRRVTAHYQKVGTSRASNRAGRRARADGLWSASSTSRDGRFSKRRRGPHVACGSSLRDQLERSQPIHRLPLGTSAARRTRTDHVLPGQQFVADSPDRNRPVESSYFGLAAPLPDATLVTACHADRIPGHYHASGSGRS